MSWGWLAFLRSREKARRERSFTFEDQMKYEAEGAESALDGHGQRFQCPYRKGSPQWNHWVCGAENAIGEMQAVHRGLLMFSSTDVGAQPYPVTLKEAQEHYGYKLKYHTPTPDGGYSIIAKSSDFK